MEVVVHSAPAEDELLEEIGFVDFVEGGLEAEVLLYPDLTRLDAVDLIEDVSCSMELVSQSVLAGDDELVL